MRTMLSGWVSGLAGPQPHEQRLAVGQHRVAVGEPPLNKDLAAVDALDTAVDLQILFDRHDLAVVDVQEGRALVRAARELRRGEAKQRVEQHRDRPAVDSAVAAQVKSAEARG